MQSEDEETTKSPVALSLTLAFALLALVFGLNLLEGPEVPVEQEQLQRLIKEGMVTNIIVGLDGLHFRLRAPIATEQEGTEMKADRLILPGRHDVSPEQVSYWESRGIEVEFDDSKPTRNWGGIILVGLLLPLGLWHVASQIYKDKKGIGAPRRRLKELEKEFRDGRISLEDYEKAREAIWAEM